MSIKEVKRTERGWAGHYCCSKDCTFRRNTLLEYKDKKWVVSTVGCQIARYNLGLSQKKGNVMPIGYNRYYETMAFESSHDEYDDADVSKEIEFDSEWSIWGETWKDVIERYGNPDLVANKMHEKVVKELMEKIKIG